MDLYKSAFRPWLFRLPPERAQGVAEALLALAPLWRAVTPTFRQKYPALRREVAGIPLSNPVGLAAGYDKQCVHLAALGLLGFGYVVGGTVTPEPRRGNPRPRLLRRPGQQALVNAMGFPSNGLERVARRLERLRPSAEGLRHRPTPIFVSIAALDEEGFARCHQRLEPLVEAVELNISSPNTAGIRVFQERDALLSLLRRLGGRRKPLFVKLPPYSDPQGQERVLSLLEICRQAGVTGVTAINTVPVEEPRLKVGTGGLSGRPLLSDMLRIVSELRREGGPDLVINACGGIFTGEDAFAALQAGADTVQLFTALVYEGPGVVRCICRKLERLVQARGWPQRT
ncbi:MAG: dihydroorotate dehydrogenase 2 [Chloroflexi bacterium]|nr:dihydroorotate dehydrogenase 2 [Chloroflexota bacterium]